MTAPIDGPQGTALRWAPAAHSELAELSGLLTLIEAHDEPLERHSLSELEESYDEEGGDPGRDLSLGRDAAGTLVGYGWVHPLAGDVDPRRVFLVGGVHPARRGEGIGTAILTWQLDRAHAWHAETQRPEHGPLLPTIYADAKLGRQLQLYERFGFTPMRWFVDLSRRFGPLSGGLPEPVVPDGFVLRHYEPRLSEPVRQAHNAAFADHWGSQPVTAGRWTQELAAASSRPDWSWVMLREPAAGTRSWAEVVGYALNSAYQQDWSFQGFKEGWTDRLGVCRTARGRGIATALLTASMRSFAEAGMEAAGLGVDTDNPSGAFALYRSLGYEAGGTTVMYGRTESL